MKISFLNILKIIFSVIAFLLGPELQAQTFSNLDIPVEIDGQDLNAAWAGGTEAPQFSEIDLNGDDFMDLYAFDRVGNVHMTYLNDGIEGELSYTYAPEFEANFPKCENFSILRDYNQDGLMDIFTYNNVPQSLRLYTGFINNDGDLDFEVFIDDEYSYDFLWFYSLPNNTPGNILVPYLDIPAIADINLDGDIDILAFDGSGVHVYMYENVGLDLEQPRFKITEYCWGGFAESALDATIFMNLTDSIECVDYLMDPTNETDGNSRHSGSTLLAFDDDGDLDKDLLIGDLTNDHMVLAINNGSLNNAWVTALDETFPSYDTPINISEFMAAYHLDLNNDGHQDLMATNNNTVGIENYYHTWFYQNIGTDQDPYFELNSTDAFSRLMQDFGSGTRPAFFDFNADGLSDILVGTDGYFLNNSTDPRLILIENIGSADSPSFEVVDFDYLGLSIYGTENWLFAPAFGDMDNDGDVDLIVGEQKGTLFYFENMGGAGNPVSFESVVPNWLDIDVGQNSNPSIIDLDKDGDLDLVIGERLGNLNYIENIGSASQFAWAIDSITNPSLGEVSTVVPNIPIIGNSAPTFIQVDDHYELLLGNKNGDLIRYTDIENNLAEGDEFTLVSDGLPLPAVGRSLTVALADLNADGMLELIAGNERGGLNLFGSDMPSSYLIQNSQRVDVSYQDINLYPNPAGDRVYVSFQQPQSIKQVRVYDMTGKLIVEQKAQLIDCSSFSTGLYTIQIIGNQGVLGVSKFVKH